MFLLLIGLAIFSFVAFHVLLFVLSRLTRGIAKSPACLLHKTAIVTGANSGLGYQTALNLASRGCRVIMADVADMKESMASIIKLTGNDNITAKKLDLGSLKSVRQFADDILTKENRLDILINNAGVGAANYNRTNDGLHPVMQINYFGHFLLTHLLIDLLKKSAPSRIVFTSSAANFFSYLTVKTLNPKRKTENSLFGFLQYADSKLAILIASDLFNEKLKGTGVVSNTVHPGVVATSIFDNFGSVHAQFLSKILEIYAKIFFKDAWDGAQVILNAALSDEYRSVGGQYLMDCRSVFKPPLAYNKDFCRKIWMASERHVQLMDEERI